MKFFPFIKKQKTTEDGAIGYEPEEQKTPRMGRLLLLILGFVLIFFGWTGLNDLRDIPNRPERLSSCYSSATTAQNFSLSILASSSCSFSAHEQEAGVPALWSEFDGAYDPITILTRRISSLNSQIRTLRRGYDTSLLEDIADQNAIGSTPEQTRARISGLEGQVRTLTAEQGQLEQQLRGRLDPLIATMQKAGDAYERAMHWYAFKIFLLEMLFTIPFFLGAFWFYMRLHGKNSPHAIIATPIVFVAGILVARVILFYFWDLFLANLLEFFWEFFLQTPILRTLLYYIGMGMAIAIFGGAVFLLQRKIYAPQRVRGRRLRANKCPHCELSLDLSTNFCAGCGKQLRVECQSCGQSRYMDLKYCPVCGKE